MAVEVNDEASQLARSAAVVLTRWTDALAAMFIRRGLPPERGHRPATCMIAAVEGAVVMCRAQRSIVPLDAVAAETHHLLVYALRDQPPAGNAPDA